MLLTQVRLGYAPCCLSLATRVLKRSLLGARVREKCLAPLVRHRLRDGVTGPERAAHGAYPLTQLSERAARGRCGLSASPDICRARCVSFPLERPLSHSQRNPGPVERLSPKRLLGPRHLC